MQNQMSDLEILYNILNIHVNESPDIPFSPSNQESMLSPVSIEDNHSISLDKEVPPLKTKKRVKFAYTDGSSTFAYETHPNIHVENSTPKCNGCDCKECNCHNREKWSFLTHVYVGSITVVGLYTLFRVLQRSR